MRRGGQAGQPFTAQRHVVLVLSDTQTAAPQKTDPVLRAAEPESAGELVVGPVLGSRRGQLEIGGAISRSLLDQPRRFHFPPSLAAIVMHLDARQRERAALSRDCLLYTSDAADERSS